MNNVPCHVFHIKAGGVEESMSPDWDLEKVFERELQKGFIRLFRQMQADGLITVTNLPQTGDYRRRKVVVEWPRE
jgi:hypothetical protein